MYYFTWQKDFADVIMVDYPGLFEWIPYEARDVAEVRFKAAGFDRLLLVWVEERAGDVEFR